MAETKWLVCGALVTVVACSCAYLLNWSGWKGLLMLAFICAFVQTVIMFMMSK